MLVRLEIGTTVQAIGRQDLDLNEMMSRLRAIIYMRLFAKRKELKGEDTVWRLSITIPVSYSIPWSEISILCH